MESASKYRNVFIYEQTCVKRPAKVALMFEPFDIFQIKDGQPSWINSAPALASAQSQVDQLGATQPGEYLIFCHRTNQKISINVAPCMCHD